MTIAEVQKRIEQIGVRKVVEEAIERAKADTKHAVLEVIESRSLTRADAIDARLKKGETVGRLAGVPFLAKIIF
jgi:Asp-tRNA(Asn)/Glu-tRNA(Gln) amidotransferase A subunit family amidase